MCALITSINTVKGLLLPSFLVKLKKDPLFYHWLFLFFIDVSCYCVVIRIAFLHRERCHKRADTDSVFSHTIFHCACSFLSLSLSVIWWLLINISYGIINLLHKGNFNIYILCIIVHGFFVSISLKKIILEYHASWMIYPGMKEWMVIEVVEREGDYWPRYLYVFCR